MSNLELYEKFMKIKCKEIPLNEKILWEMINNNEILNQNPSLKYDIEKLEINDEWLNRLRNLAIQKIITPNDINHLLNNFCSSCHTPISHDNEAKIDTRAIFNDHHYYCYYCFEIGDLFSTSNINNKFKNETKNDNKNETKNDTKNETEIKNFWICVKCKSKNDKKICKCGFKNPLIR